MTDQTHPLPRQNFNGYAKTSDGERRDREDVATDPAAAGRGVHIRVDDLGVQPDGGLVVDVRGVVVCAGSGHGGIRGEHEGRGGAVQQRAHRDASHHPAVRRLGEEQQRPRRRRLVLARTRRHGSHVGLWSEVRDRLWPYAFGLYWFPAQRRPSSC